MNIDRIRYFVIVVIAFALTSCVSTSLEDAAPTAQSNKPTSLAVVDQEITSPDARAVKEANANQQSVANSTDSSVSDVQANRVIGSSTVENNIIPSKPAGEQFPTFAEERRGETNQMTPEQKAAIEAQMTELLIQRETDPRIKARYQARLRSLRQLAKTHVSDTSAKIEQ